jgi:hypothetical protein
MVHTGHKAVLCSQIATVESPHSKWLMLWTKAWLGLLCRHLYSSSRTEQWLLDRKQSCRWRGGFIPRGKRRHIVSVLKSLVLLCHKSKFRLAVSVVLPVTRALHYITAITCSWILESDWLRAGRPRGQSLSPDAVKNFLFSTSPDRLWSPPSLLCRGKAAGTWRSSLTSN